MLARPWGKSGVEVPVIGEGTWRMEGDDHRACIESLRSGLDAGLTHVDTAELYGNGRVEELIVREAIAGRRDEVFLVSKVRPDNASYAGTLKACERSLTRLGTDRLDAYLLHWPGEHPLEETIRAFEKLKKDGKIRAWGVSNFDVAELEEALAIAGEGQLACNQVLYHLEERAIEKSVIPWCREHGVPVVGYSPFGAGDFPKASSKGGRALQKIATRLGAGVRQVALAFLVRDPICWTIPKTANAAHARENAKAGDLVLDADAIRELDEAFPAPRQAGALPVI